MRPFRGDLSTATIRALTLACRFHRRMREDIDQSAELGRAEAKATGGDLDGFVLRAVTATVRELAQVPHYREAVLEGIAVDRRLLLRGTPPPMPLTAIRRKHLERDALISLAVRHGYPQMALGRVLGISRSRIQEIAAEFPHRTEPEPEPESIE